MYAYVIINNLAIFPSNFQTKCLLSICCFNSTQLNLRKISLLKKCSNVFFISVASLDVAQLFLKVDKHEIILIFFPSIFARISMLEHFRGD
jgi:hypothetical protein